MKEEYQFAEVELDELYREVILDHYRNPRNRKPVEGADIEREGFNPFCGDDIVLQVRMADGDHIEDIGFHGQGCSISQASASMLTDLVKGKTLKDAQEIMEMFRAIMRGNEPSEEELERLGDLEALQGVRKFPMRIKCALLAWSALEEGIEEYRAKTRKS